MKEIKAVAQKIRAQVGYPTVLINNAGVARGKAILEAKEKDVRFTFDVNSLAHYWLVQEFLPAMVENNHGMIVTVASIASWVTGECSQSPLLSPSPFPPSFHPAHMLCKRATLKPAKLVPNMTDYASSKAAALAFHQGLTAELATRYNAPKVRTVSVHQGYTKTALFQGYNNTKDFFLPTLEPETVAEAIVRQVLSGRSGQIICPPMATAIPILAFMPHWIQERMRKEGAEIMPAWHGRQVVENLDTYYEGKEKDVESSTVLVPKPDGGANKN